MNLNIINMLPNDIIEYIWKFVNKRQKIFISKSYYIKYNSYIDKVISGNYMESYIRDIVRKDYFFSFKNMFYRYLTHWMQMKNYPYSNNMVFTNYIHFLKFYAEKNSSHNCLNFIKKHLITDNLKSHKYKSSKNSKWRN